MTERYSNPSVPDFSVENNNSIFEVYGWDMILREQSGRIYDRSDFGGNIMNLTLDQEKLIVANNQSGMALTLNINLDPYREKGVYDTVATIISQLYTQHFDARDVGFPAIRNLKYIVTQNGLRLALWHDAEHNRIILSNNLSLGTTKGGSGITEEVLNVDPISLDNMDPQVQMKDFALVTMVVTDKIAEKPLARTYRVGENVTSIPSARSVGGAAIRKTQAENPKKKEDPKISDSFEGILSSVDEKVSLSDIGGLEDVKRELQDIALSFSNPEVMEKWGAKRPQGILLYGPPGTGKTMLVEALANEVGSELLKVQSSDIYVKWLGDSESKIKELFARFRSIDDPTLVLFDEFDAIVGITEHPSSGSDNARNSVAGIFKQEMNNLAKINPNVLVVATTNNEDRIDPSLIRSGRFDHKIYVPMPDDEARVQIITAKMSSLMLTRDSDEFKMFGEDVDVPVLGKITDGLSGADIAEIFRRLSLSKAMQEARKGRAESISQADFFEAISEFKSEFFR